MDASFAARLKFEVLYRVSHIQRRAIHARFFKSPIQQAARGSDKWSSLLIFFVPGLLSYQDDACFASSFAEDGLRRVAEQIATLAMTGGFGEFLQIRSFRHPRSRRWFLLPLHVYDRCTIGW